MPQPTTVNDCMRRQPLTIRPEANLVEAVELIVQHRLTGLSVTDEVGQVQGVLSEIDCLRGILASIYNDGDPAHALVSCRNILWALMEHSRRKLQEQRK